MALYPIPKKCFKRNINLVLIIPFQMLCSYLKKEWIPNSQVQPSPTGRLRHLCHLRSFSNVQVTKRPLRSYLGSYLKSVTS